MLTPPSDLAETTLRAVLADRWGLSVAAMEYRAVGFGAHHWELGDVAGGRWFVSATDLRPRRVWGGEPLDAGFGRLRGSLEAAAGLRRAGRDFVLAPVPGRDGELLGRIEDAFAVAVYPWVAGESFGWDDYTDAHRRAMLELVIDVHGAPPEVRDLATVDDYAIPFREAFAERMPASAGIYARRVDDLLAAHPGVLGGALERYAGLVAGVRRDPPALVLTHGEPHPGNTMRVDGRWLMIDWETALAAPPERDVWHLDSLGPAYTEETGTMLRAEILELYRMRWDLTEIAMGLDRFRAPHGDTADDQETWENLAESLATLAGGGR